ncbi:MAG: restriction endonuclease subunit S [Lentisphaeria bacterium]|nr:restriction endonuclease subunit S [Lentisphaeria bacterium]
MKRGWQTKTLGEVCEIYRGGSPRPIKDFITTAPSGINWIKIGDVSPDGKYIDRTAERILSSGIKYSRFVERGDFLLTNSMSFGRPYICRIDGCIHDGWLVLKKINDSFIPDFLYYLLRSPNVSDQFDLLAKGSTVRNLNRDSVAKVIVSVPSISEQKRIVGILDAAFEKIDAVQRNAERNLANAKELFQRVLDEEMTPKKGWSAAPLKDLTTDLGDGIHGTPLYDSSGDYYFINGNNLERGKIVFREKTKRVSISEAKKYTLPLNDKTVLVSINGTLGRVAFYQGEKIVLGKSACYFNLRECIDKNFAYLIFSSEIFMRYAKKEATGVTINNVSLKSMRNFLIYYPNLSEQKSIVQIIRKFQERLFLAAQRSSETISICEKLKTALLAKAFNGEL